MSCPRAGRTAPQVFTVTLVHGPRGHDGRTVTMSFPRLAPVRAAAIHR